MKAKWYLSTFIFILTLIGVGQLQFSVPNQEIVVQFTNNEVTLLETQNTIAIVKKQLQDIGVDNIQVHNGDNGKLKITYYSDVDVASIKKIFSEEKKLSLSFTSLFQIGGSSDFPSNKKSNSFKLDVFEIQKSNDTDGDFNGFALDLMPENDRFFKPNVYFSTVRFDIRKKKDIEKVAYILYRDISIEIDNSSHNIPEVRAGPVASLNS